jgi:hypothetical protein
VTAVIVRSAAAAGLLSLLVASAAAAADDYTFPFYDPNTPFNVGVDRDRRQCVQLDYTGQTWWDCEVHWGRVYDQHTGIDWGLWAGTAVAAARDGTVVDYFEWSGTHEKNVQGNYILLEHADGKRTLYYHLAHMGALGELGQKVVAGEQVGISGCSGFCLGDHLHFELLVKNQNTGLWEWRDPQFERRWTTWPGRVPFLATYVRENNSGTEWVPKGNTRTHWVEFRNDGGRTWRNDIGRGRILLGTWNPATHASPFRAWDWGSSWRATNVDWTTGPDQIGRFTFGLYGGPPAGYYEETFNLLANSIYWFDHARLGSFYVPIQVFTIQKQ